jgi:hypothetical protein
VFLAAAAEPNRSPLDFMLALMRDPQVPLDERIDLAAKAAPFVHARPTPVRKKRPDPLDLRDRLGETGDLKFGTVEAKPDPAKPAANAAQGGGAGGSENAGAGGESGGAGGGQDQSPGGRQGEVPGGAEAGGEGCGAGGAKRAVEGEGLSPLDFLLGVMNDPTASPEQRVKAANVAARYKHPFAGESDVPTVSVVEDKFGFKVDPQLARAERDDRLRESNLKVFKERSAAGIAAKPELERIEKRRAERVALVQFPDGYSYDDREADRKRLGELYGKRLSRKKLTPEEDAEEAHLAVRVLYPKALKPRAVVISDFSIEWPTTRIAELDERVVGGEVLTPPEEAERQELRRRYPESAAQADRIDHRYRYWLRKEREIALKSGMEYSKAADAKCEALRDQTKIAYADLPMKLIQRLHRLESLCFDELLIPEEAEELEELHRLYPQRTDRARKFVHGRLSDDQVNRDYMLRTGSKPRPIGQGQWPRIWTEAADDARSRTPGPPPRHP